MHEFVLQESAPSEASRYHRHRFRLEGKVVVSCDKQVTRLSPGIFLGSDRLSVLSTAVLT